MDEKAGEATERTGLREDRHPHEFLRPTAATRYAEIRHDLGRVPDPTRLRESTHVKDWVSEQRQIEADTGAHALKEHLVSETVLYRRAASGERARGGVDRYPARNATGFRSEEAMAAAVAVAWDHPDVVWQRTEIERRYSSARALGASRALLEGVADRAYVVHIGPVEKSLGPDWREHVQGYARGGAAPTGFRNAVIKTTWKMTPKGRWRLDSCFPIADWNEDY